MTFSLLFKKPNIAFLLIFTIGALEATLYFLEKRQSLQAALIQNYESETATRYEIIKIQLNKKKLALKSIQRFFEASSWVEKGEFSLFTEELFELYGLNEICWFASNTQEFFLSSSQRENPSPLCSKFNVAEPNRVLPGPIPQIMMSEFATSLGGQRGFIVITFPFDSLSLVDSLYLKDALVVSDTLQNEFLNYSFQTQKLEKNTSSAKDTMARSHYFALEDIDVSHILYLSQLPTETLNRIDIRPALSIGLMILAICTILGLYLRNILQQKEEISRLVEIKTRELKSSQKDLLKTNEELEQFAYRTSHDLKAPLSSIKSLTRIMLHQLHAGDHQEVVANLGKVSSLSRRLESLVSDLLHLARASHLEGPGLNFDFTLEVEQIFQTLRASLPTTSFELKASIAENIDFKTHPVRMRQVLENLISNAIKYHNPERPNPYVQVEIQTTSEQVSIHISDNGQGIPPEHHANVFGLFERFHHGIEGSGLGLYLVQKHVEAMKGQIDFDSSSAGTCFKIALPLAVDSSNPISC